MSRLRSATTNCSTNLVHRGICWFVGFMAFILPLTARSQQPQPTPRPVPQASQPTVQRNHPSHQPASKRMGVNGSSNPITPRRDISPDDRQSQSSVQSISIWKMLGVLMLAIAGIFGAAKLLKSWGPFQAVNPLPNSVFAVLGHTTLPPRHTLYLVRIGQKVVLLGATNDNLTNLTEISDEKEIASLAHLCQVKSESEEDSMFSRLLKQVKPLGPEDNAATSNPSNARDELEARLKSFAHS